ncbi:glycosyltransferase [Guptibacillus algicola]|uniref:glycosyltransferase family protein n=1 Tax=Guptibacillus algicola TaxID=225844 RepID=UPI001CD62B05|nr:glycosyltransferase [Alkalihalobacillus algicola]MCA0987851.1 glycosyltransferase [Alkalihalobacillus algicola]
MQQKRTILFITKDLSKHVERSSFYLIRELQKRSNVILWHDHGLLPEILMKLQVKPDFILLNDYHPTYCPHIRDLDKTNIPVGIFMHDLHYKKMRRKRLIEKNHVSVIFAHYRDAFIKWYPEFQDRLVWLPHHVETSIFKDYQLEKSMDYLMMGALFSDVYPFRTFTYNKLNSLRNFHYHKHPGYKQIGRGSITGDAYAKELNRTKMFFTCDSIYHYPVLKYFEAPACNTLLLASSSKELTDLGFVDGETFVSIDERNVMQKAAYYLKHEEERLRIARAGFQMVHKNHSTSKRADELLRHIEKVITDQEKTRR